MGSLKLALNTEWAAELHQQVQLAKRSNVSVETIKLQEAGRCMPIHNLEGAHAVTVAAHDGYVGQPARLH